MTSHELLVTIYILALEIVLGFVILGVFIASIVYLVRGLLDGHRRRRGVKHG